MRFPYRNVTLLQCLYEMNKKTKLSFPLTATFIAQYVEGYNSLWGCSMTC